jgi:hypothetical protein
MRSAIFPNCGNGRAKLASWPARGGQLPAGRAAADRVPARAGSRSTTPAARPGCQRAASTPSRTCDTAASATSLRPSGGGRAERGGQPGLYPGVLDRRRGRRRDHPGARGAGDPAAVLAAVSTYAVTSMAATVDNYLELMDRPDFTGHDLSSLRAAAAMSFVTKLRPDIRHRWQAATGGASVLGESAYGMTETHTIDTFLTGLRGRRPGPGVPSGLLRAAHARYRTAADRDRQGQEARAGPASRTSGRLTPRR